MNRFEEACTGILFCLLCISLILWVADTDYVQGQISNSCTTYTRQMSEYSGSYAIDPSVQLGDIDQNGIVNISDVRKLVDCVFNGVGCVQHDTIDIHIEWIDSVIIVDDSIVNIIRVFQSTSGKIR